MTLRDSEVQPYIISGYQMYLPVVRIIFIIVVTWQMQTTRADETDPGDLFQQAQASYEAAQYQSSLAQIQQAIALDPDNSSYYHLLGKCYGRLAEHANPLLAYSLAKKTRKALEKAVELDGRNIRALQDLMQYYLQAPGFLGGGQQKAEKIQKILKDIETSKG